MHRAEAFLKMDGALIEELVSLCEFKKIANVG